MNLNQLEAQAVEAALENNWEKAVELNEAILKQDPKNLDALLRLGFASFQTGDYKKSKAAYKKIIQIQPHNPIAKEKLKQINILMKEKNTEVKNLELDPNLFTDVPGKTKTISLVNLGQKNVLAKLNVGEPVVLKIRKRKVEVRTQKGDYIGCLPDDLSKRLILFINAGSEYTAYIKEATLKEVVVFIKEIKKSRKLKKFISFPEDLHKNITSLEKLAQTDSDHPKEEEDQQELEDEEEEKEEIEEIEELAESLDEFEEKSQLLVPYSGRVEDDEEEEEE